MRKMHVRLALTAAALAATMGSAGAADIAEGYGRGGYKDGPVGVPVPAPMPIPESFAWYVRIDAGAGWKGKPSVSEDGFVSALGRPRSAVDDLVPGSLVSALGPIEADFSLSANFSLGVGYYFTPNIRGDITVGTHGRGETKRLGSYTYNTQNFDASVTRTITGTAEDRGIMRSVTTMANVYYDILPRGRFTPYIGAGLGFSVNEVERKLNGNEVCVASVGLAENCTAINQIQYQSYKYTDKSHTVSLAASATAGIAVQLSSATLLDVNYRFTYIGGTQAELSKTSSILTLGDTAEHALRAGLRWNIQ